MTFSYIFLSLFTMLSDTGYGLDVYPQNNSNIGHEFAVYNQKEKGQPYYGKE